MAAERDRFQHEIGQFHDRFARPVYFGRRDEHGVFHGNSATGTLLQISGRYFGVTCQHVIREYRKRQAEGAIEFFYFGDSPIDPEALRIDESKRLDLITFDLTMIVGSGPNLMPTNFYEPPKWPPSEISEGDIIAVLGFPGEWREQFSPNDIAFHQFAQSATIVESVSDEQIAVRIAIDESVFIRREKEMYGFAGGISGGPAFVWRSGVLLTTELAGFVYEYLPPYDILYIRRARCVAADGSLLK